MAYHPSCFQKYSNTVLCDESDAQRGHPIFNSMNAASARESSRSLDDAKTIRAISRASKYLAQVAEPFRFRTLFITLSNLSELMRTIRSKMHVKDYVWHLHVIAVPKKMRWGSQSAD